MKSSLRVSMLTRYLTAFVLLVSFLAFLSSCSLFGSKAPTKISAKTTPQVETTASAPYLKIDLSCPASAITSPKLYVYKSSRRLQVIQDNVLVRDYLVGLGPSPSGDKVMMGDGRTPEGEFFICVKNSSSKFYKSLGISYPSPRHAEQALNEGRISLDDYRCILQANDSKCMPPSNTTLGGAIFIHGGGGYQDWTLGCIAVSDSTMDELFQIIPVGTPVQVLP